MSHEVRARTSTVVHKTERPTGHVTANCGTALGLDPWLGAEARVWHPTLASGRSPVLTDCGVCFVPHIDDLSQPVTSGFKVPDPHPTVSVQHRCPRMREHVTGYGEPGSHPGDLPVPCEDCYSLIVTTVAVRWQPKRPFTTVFEENPS